jgi:integrase
MPRPRNIHPAYLHHKPTNQAYVRVPYGSGGRKTVYLGAHGSQESKAEYRRLLAELDAATAAGAVLAARSEAASHPDLTLSELYLAFWKFALQHYRRPDGSNTDQLVEFRQTFRIALALYGGVPAREFGPLALKTVRQKMIESDVSRSVVNDRCRRIRFVFKWGAAEELVPVATYQALACVAGLQRGRSGARETDPRRPVHDTVVDATLPFLGRHIRGLVQLQRLTGCRPGEAMTVRRCDLDETGAVWVYRPAHHKTAHKGKGRAIAIGPQAQALLKTFFTDDPIDYLFSPARYEAERLAERATNRKTPRYPSHLKRNAAKRAPVRKRPPRSRYDRTSYLNAVVRACARAFPLTGELARLPGESATKWKARLNGVQTEAVKRWRREHRWFPYQLRHTFATKVREQFDLEAAQVLLGHERADVTQIYAAKNNARAAQIAVAIG